VINFAAARSSAVARFAKETSATGAVGDGHRKMTRLGQSGDRHGEAPWRRSGGSDRTLRRIDCRQGRLISPQRQAMR
jgi:hypothetical protein